MNRDKQIEEMAKVYEEARLRASDTLGSMNEGAAMWYAKALYNAGYRKDSEVAKLEQDVTRLVQEKDALIKNYAECMRNYAREIFEEIEVILDKLDKQHILCGNPKQAWGVRSARTKVAELKNKYTEGEI